MINWETVKDDFKWDGSLRDIYVVPATLNDWRTVYPFLRDHPDVEFIRDGSTCDAPQNIDASFFAGSRPVLRLKVGRVCVVFHFFTPEEIECDIDPREVTSQADLDALLDFIRELGDRTNKRVAITPENLCGEPFLQYAPETKSFQYLESTPKPF